MNNQFPPFAVGQKVVALVDATMFKKGDILVVRRCYKACCFWMVELVGKVWDMPVNGRCKCGSRLVINIGDNGSCDSVVLAPIIGDMQAVTFEKIVEQEPVSVN